MYLTAQNFFLKKTAKLGIFLQNILWESCLKCDFEQLSHSMSVRNIAPSYGFYEKCVSLATAKRAIFVTGMLWESCSNSHFKQLSHSMFCRNIPSLAVFFKNNFLAAKYKNGVSYGSTY